MYRLSRAAHLARPLLYRRIHGGLVNRSPKNETLEHKTRELEREIRLMEEKLKTNQSAKSVAGDHLSEEDISKIYAEVAASAERQATNQPKISQDYLERLKVKFLDTRPVQSNAIAAAGGEVAEQTNAVITNGQSKAIAKESPALSAKDFDQLIYANALTKRSKEAETLLELMPSYGIQPTVKSFNHVIDAYANANDSENAVRVYKALREAGASPDTYTFGALVKSFVNSNRIDDASVLFEKMKAAGMTPSEASPIFAKLISGYLRLNNTAKAWDVFDEMQLKYHKPDEVTYTMMIHACAKNDEVERALNLFEDMSNRGLYPTDVTFNTIINACARRPDYYDEAFNLLGQMQEVHGFVPDQVTYNTLLHGCAKKKDLNRAREIYRLILQKSASNGDHPQLAADDRTYSSLFWTYASYRPQRQKNLASEPEKASDSALVPADESPLFPSLPSNRSELVKEAQSIFSYAKENTTINSAILNAYLGVHIAHHASGETIAIYQDLFDHWKVTRDGFTFKHILEHCYRTKDLQLAYKVWDDREEWLDGMRQSHYIEENEPQAVKRRKQLDLISSQTTNGWTVADQKESVLLMANTMSRCNDLDAAVRLLHTHFDKNFPLGHLKLSQVKTTYNKCIQLDDKEARSMLLALCPLENSKTVEKTRLLAKKWGTSRNDQRWNSKRR